MHYKTLSEFTCMLLRNHFYLDSSNKPFNGEGICYKVSSDYGYGYCNLYTNENKYCICILDFMLFNKERSIMPKKDIQNFSPLFKNKIIRAKDPDTIYSCYLKISSLKGDVEYYISQKNKYIHFTGIVFHNNFIESQISSFGLKDTCDLKCSFFTLSSNELQPDIIYLFKQIENCRLTGIAARVFYESKTLEVLSHLINTPKKCEECTLIKSICSEDIIRLNSVIKFINNHYEESLSINKLSKIACMGTTKLKSTFKMVYSTTISNYIFNHRMNKAKELLIQSTNSIYEISRDVGYKKPGSFSHAFKKHTGLLPSDFRKKFQDNI